MRRFRRDFVPSNLQSSVHILWDYDQGLGMLREHLRGREGVALLHILWDYDQGLGTLREHLRGREGVDLLHIQ